MALDPGQGGGGGVGLVQGRQAALAGVAARGGRDTATAGIRVMRGVEWSVVVLVTSAQQPRTAPDPGAAHCGHTHDLEREW